MAALAIFFAFCVALFFNGNHALFLSVPVALLIIIIGLGVASHNLGQFKLALSPIGITLSLLLIWSALSLLWSQVTYVSQLYFWWTNGFILTFYGFSLLKDKQLAWQLLWLAFLCAGCTLSAYALFEFIVLEQAPNAMLLNKNSLAALLNLIVLPSAAYYLIGKRALCCLPPIASLAVVFLLTLCIAVISSRGATIGLSVGLAVLASLSFRKIPSKRIVILLTTVLISYLLIDLVVNPRVSATLASLADPVEASNSRVLIWTQALQMLQHAPVLGIGLGIFWLYWPQFRAPADTSAGFYAHNDYLQIWIELGGVGLILFVAVLVAITFGLRRLMQAKTAPADVKIVGTGIYCALISTYMHSLFTFNFYILPILIMFGVLLGRFYQLVYQYNPARQWSGTLPAHCPLGLVRVMIALAVIFPLLFLTTYAMSYQLYQRAIVLAETGDLPAAESMLRQAARVSPNWDLPYVAHADLISQTLPELIERHPEEAKTYFTQALSDLARAEENNPLRAQVHMVKGDLYRRATQLAGTQWYANAKTAYQTALQLDPRLFTARMALVQLLTLKEDRQYAAKVIVQGMQYWYPDSPRIVPFYQLAAENQLQLGNTHQAQSILAKIQEINLNAQPGSLTDVAQ